MTKPNPATFVLGGVGVLFVAGALLLVAASLSRPEVETYAPSPRQPETDLDGSGGPHLYTVDATRSDSWVYFDFSEGTVVEVDDRSSLDWDVAFQRHRMLTNGGATNPEGQGGVADLGPTPLDPAQLRVPARDFVADERRGDEPRNRALEEWYDYSWTNHILTPSDRTFVFRTADGGLAAVRFVGYYCPGAVPGCVTFRYWYAGEDDAPRRERE